MSEALYMSKIERLLEDLSETATKEGESLILHRMKKWTIKTLVKHYGLNQDDAEGQVAAAVGEEP